MSPELRKLWNLNPKYLNYLKLMRRCIFHRYLYYDLARPVMEDLDYDKLERQLEAEENKLDFKSKISPTVTVGNPTHIQLRVLCLIKVLNWWRKRYGYDR